MHTQVQLTHSHTSEDPLCSAHTLESAGRMQNSVVEMFTDRGLMLNLVTQRINEIIIHIISSNFQDFQTAVQ